MNDIEEFDEAYKASGLEYIEFKSGPKMPWGEYAYFVQCLYTVEQDRVYYNYPVYKDVLIPRIKYIVVMEKNAPGDESVLYTTSTCPEHKIESFEQDIYDRINRT